MKWPESLARPWASRSRSSRPRARKVIERYVSKGVPPEAAEHTAGFLNAVAEGDFADGSLVLTDILGREPIPLLETFKGWVAAHKAR